jgi:hypothetical protein
MNDVLLKIWKESVVICFEVLSWNLTVGTVKKRQKAVMVTGNPAKI